MKFTHAMKTVFISLVVAALVGGCSGMPSKGSGNEAGSVGAVSDMDTTDSTYKIQPGDKLFISVYNEDELQKDIVVGPDGGITFPLVGDLEAKGKSIAQLRGEITERLSKYIPDATVSVSLKEVIGNKIFVLGQVKKPGEYVLTGGTDVLQALSMAGGLTAFANSNKIKILRRNRDTNEKEVIPFSYKQIMHGEGLDQNITLRSGDTIVVP